MKFNLVSVGDESNLTAFIDGEMYVANNTHPYFDQIVQRVLAGDETVTSLFSPAQEIAKQFDKVSDRVSISGGTVYFDGEAVNNTLADQIMRFIRAGSGDFKPLVNFYEKIATNPNEHSREQLYTWLRAHDFTITPDGDIVGYKGVQKIGDSYQSISQGPAVVDGQEVNGHVPNPIGSVVEMARSNVTHDPGRACSAGLHVGTWGYARGFSREAVLEVHVNPRDVVSVPTDSGGQKMRVCRYTVVKAIDTPYTSPVASGYDDSDDDDYDEDYVCDCGCTWCDCTEDYCDCDDN